MVVTILFRFVLTSRGVVRVRAQIARPCVHARVAPRCVSDPARAMGDDDGDVGSRDAPAMSRMNARGA
jgi:hypothetical protein